MMTIKLPEDVERSIEAAVRVGHFASVDDAMAEAARLLLLELGRQAGRGDLGPDPVLGSMRDAADELDEIVADAMRRRREEPWRSMPDE